MRKLDNDTGWQKVGQNSHKQQDGVLDLAIHLEVVVTGKDETEDEAERQSVQRNGSYLYRH